MMADESIYNLIQPAPTKYQKLPKYQSKFRPVAKDEYFTKPGKYRTMGQAKVPTRSTNDFLKKHEKEPKLPTTSTLQKLPAEQKFHYPDEEAKRPAVPRKDDMPPMGLKTTKNFINQNAVHNIVSVPKKPAKIVVDTVGGDKLELERSGLEPKFVHKKDYGQVPGYLSKRQDEVRRAQDEYDAYVAENFRRGAMKQLSTMERDSLLDGLKTNWEQIHHEYQSLSVVTDTPMKKFRKERMEADMKQLERDIEAIEKHSVIYIAD